jgi:rRNA processing protein Gar1
MGNMRFLGVIQGSTPKGDMVAKATGSVETRAGDKVYNGKKKHFGSVRRLFGPVKAPYVSIKTKRRGQTPETVGSEVYIEDNKG